MPVHPAYSVDVPGGTAAEAGGNLAAVPTPAGRSGAPASLRPDRPSRATLAELAEHLGLAPPAGSGGVAVEGVTLDSRQVRPGDLYAALPGARAHGADFSAAAAQAGAAAVLTDADGAARARGTGLPVLVTADPRAVLGGVSARVYGDPAEQILLLGVTGTNGKTTTTYLLDAALRSAGRTTGLVGTVETRVADEAVPSVRTTPESPDVHALLAVMVERGVQVCSIEVSSHALALHRVDGVVFDVAAFTNLSQDHLDFHDGLDDYFAVKSSLFTPERSRRGVVCVDDEWGVALAASATVPVTTVTTLDGVRADWHVEAPLVGADGRTRFTLVGPGGRRVAATSPLPGAFNVANTALALVVLEVAGLDLSRATEGLAQAPGVPGRMERVAAGGGPLAVVDYAHTPDAVTAALVALRSSTPGRLVVVLGAGGDRDPHKREAMGVAAAGGADLVIVTDDNPRSEAPEVIRAALLTGARSVAQSAASAGPSRVEVVEVADRADAVLAAVRAAPSTGDTVLVAGKGHEQGQEIDDEVLDFDDREVLRRALLAVAAERAEVGL